MVTLTAEVEVALEEVAEEVTVVAASNPGVPGEASEVEPRTEVNVIDCNVRILALPKWKLL